MQPYLFPYIGYFQLIASVDQFVFFDDCKFRKNSWINRNRLLVHGRPVYFTLPLVASSSSTAIQNMACEPAQAARTQEQLVKTMLINYPAGEHRDVAIDLIRSVFSGPVSSISQLAESSVKMTARLLGINRDWGRSSLIDYDRSLSGPDRVIDICQSVGASEYWNAVGGKALYESDCFTASGISLRFSEPVLRTYRQGSTDHFVAGLSILDALARVGAECTSGLVQVGRQ